MKPGDRVCLPAIQEEYNQPGSPAEYGVVIASWLDENGDEDCYVVFFGDSFPIPNEEPNKPYVLRYYASSLEKVK